MVTARRNEEYLRTARRRRRKRTLALCALVAVSLLAVYIACYDRQWYDPASQEGYYEGKSKAEIEASLNQVVAEGEFNISVCTPIMKKDSGGYEVRFENIAANHRDCIVTLYAKDDPGKVLCRTSAMAPGTYIQNEELDTTGLESGPVDCVALFETYRHEPTYPTIFDRLLGSYETTHAKTGQVAAEVQDVVS